MLKRGTIILFILLCCFCLYAVSYETIKNNPEYLYGVGIAENMEKANHLALNDLITKISVNVSSQFTNVSTDNGSTSSDTSELIIKTYSSTTLNNVGKLEQEQADGKCQVVRYIEKQKMHELFENRKNLLFELIGQGLTAEKNMRIGDALKYYYWSFALLKTIPEYIRISYDFPQTGNKLCLTWLPEKINQLLSGVKVSLSYVRNEEGSNIACIEFYCKYNELPVDMLDYKYRAGSYWSQRISLRDGLGFADIEKDLLKDLSSVLIGIEYKYIENSKVIDEVWQVLNGLPTPDFNNQCSLELKERPVKKETPEPVKVEKESLLSEKKALQYQTVLQKICQAIEKKDYPSVQSLFTENGYNQFLKIISYGQARLFKDPLANVNYVLSDNRVIARSVPMRFKFKSAQNMFVEKVYFSFSENGLIDELGFTLSNRSQQDILNKTQAWGSFNTKMTLLEFMERYKTAYCLKDGDYINSVFSENALIIIGRVLKPELDPERKIKPSEKIQYVRYTKQDFITNLRRAFQSNEFINVQFEESNVRRMENEPVYGIQLYQSYTSSSYADKGYLFLMIDLNDEKKPVIYVRSWQPKKNPDGSVIGLEDFHF